MKKTRKYTKKLKKYGGAALSGAGSNLANIDLEDKDGLIEIFPIQQRMIPIYTTPDNRKHILTNDTINIIPDRSEGKAVLFIGKRYFMYSDSNYSSYEIVINGKTYSIKRSGGYFQNAEPSSYIKMGQKDILIEKKLVFNIEGTFYF
jgi:hypothetical protein